MNSKRNGKGVLHSFVRWNSKRFFCWEYRKPIITSVDGWCIDEWCRYNQFKNEFISPSFQLRLRFRSLLMTSFVCLRMRWMISSWIKKEEQTNHSYFKLEFLFLFYSWFIHLHRMSMHIDDQDEERYAWKTFNYHITCQKYLCLNI